MNDLVSYNEKHNEPNGENNQDGSSNNLSWNSGAEGPTNDPEITNLRERQKRNMLATLLLSQGTPMLVAGDEFGRTQQGNNNAYCQDDEISWLDWDGITAEGKTLLDFTRKLSMLRRSFPILRRNRFLMAERNEELGVKDALTISRIKTLPTFAPMEFRTCFRSRTTCGCRKPREAYRAASRQKLATMSRESLPLPVLSESVWMRSHGSMIRFRTA